MRRHERQVFVYDIKVERRKEHAPYPGLEEIANVWANLFQAGDVNHEREKGDVVYRIGDMSIDQNARLLKILIRRGDIHAANPFFHNRQTGLTRAVARDATEDGERAAHLIISLDPEQNTPHTYLAHLEGVPGLSHRSVQALLNALIKRTTSRDQHTFTFEDPAGARTRAGAPKMHTFVPHIEFEGRPSASMVNDLEQGHVQDMVLIDRRPQNQLGGNQHLIEREKYLVVGASPHLPRQGRLNAMITAAQSQQANFQSVRLRFRDPQGNLRKVDYDIATGNPEQEEYVQSYMINNIHPPMDDSSISLVRFITDHISDRVTTDRDT